MKVKTASHGIIMKKEFDPELVSIQADRQRFKQILFNLLGNAIKFSKDGGGIVTVTTKKVGGMAQFQVSDTGIGIKKEVLPGLFKKFQKGDPKTPGKYGGPGLGLAISKQLVELHGGKIKVESKYGEGSTFTFLLPINGKNN
ncbi:Methyl sulfide methyltransferase-associated sensor [uncultured archaeon]|nr:Methyl sulfide methyltransferase-associated sensor [uncultured archaeon]